ncbi:TauD/TfdA dioxygenase family protein [Rhodosalinus sp. K401]|uniref:TauD/TfdA dioxygenase family protein n=1 Tax=Rhodosalinus sp. K401 TaxID=3239195 RepID=UPI0035236B9F
MPQIQRLTGFLGAQMQGTDLRALDDPDLRSALRSALAEHQLLIIRDQSLSIEDQKRLTEVFGELMQLPYVAPMHDDPSVIAVLKEAHEDSGGVFGGEWHSDFSFLDNPPAGSVLNAQEIPPVGGDTLWSSQIAAFETLPEHLKSFLDGRRAVHVGKPYGVKFAPPSEARANASIRMTRGDPEADCEVLHPAVLINPDTGARALYLNPIYTTRFDGMTEEESRPFLEQIYKHAVRPDFSVRHKWRAGDVVIWDNRMTLHYATNDYAGFRRLIYRTTFRSSPLE